MCNISNLDILYQDDQIILIKINFYEEFRFFDLGNQNVDKLPFGEYNDLIYDKIGNRINQLYYINEKNINDDKYGKYFVMVGPNQFYYKCLTCKDYNWYVQIKMKDYFDKIKDFLIGHSVDDFSLFENEFIFNYIPERMLEFYQNDKIFDYDDLINMSSRFKRYDIVEMIIMDNKLDLNNHWIANCLAYENKLELIKIYFSKYNSNNFANFHNVIDTKNIEMFKFLSTRLKIQYNQIKKFNKNCRIKKYPYIVYENNL